ncbi:HEPN domain-containing protein [Candidatus Palauibacter sp.]|uniref:HEPN domain-containing protein n=1 Tax=Candidatus Palauibacter sp. TaxID=3101350 RepID=UPI003AF2C5A4
MTPRDRPPAAEPQAWMDHARSNLALASKRAPAVRLGDLCFNAQQAVEKALKGLLVSRKMQIPMTHDLSHLLTLLEDTGLQVPTHVFDALALSPYAVAARYPGTVIRGPSVSVDDYESAIEIAARVVEWAESVL